MKINRRITGKMLAILLVLCMLTALTACGADDDDTRPSRNETAGDVTPTNTPFPTDTPVPTDTPTPTPEPDTGGEALAQLIEIVNQAQDTAEGTYKTIRETDLDEEYKWFSEMASTVKTDRDTLVSLRSQAAEIKGLDDNIREASDSFFEMLVYSHKAVQNCLQFFADTVPILSVARPDLNGNYTFNEAREMLNVWYNDTRKKIDAITNIPSCMSADWEQYKKTFALNETILQKAAAAVELDDWLRYFSCRLLFARFTKADERAFSALVDAVQGEVEFAEKQKEFAILLANEIRGCADLDKEKRARYSFVNRHVNEVVLEYEALDTIYPMLYNTYNSFAIIKTGCISGTHKITVEAEIPGYTQKYRQSFTLDASFKSIRIKPPVTTGTLNLSSAKNAQLVLSVYEQDGFTLIETQTYPITLKSQNDFEWISDEYGLSTMDNILCYLTPESSAITQLKRTAIDEISAMTGGQMESFPGYQGSQWNKYVITYLQAAGVMRALNVQGVRYNMDAFSISNSNQHILLPSEVLENRSGLCIETSLVVASALQSANMHTFLVFPPGHAQVAVETWDGSGEYFLIETTALADKQNTRSIFVDGANALIKLQPPAGSITYYSTSDWYDYLTQGVDYLIDCDDSIILGRTTATY